jgi:thymidylate kinase
MFTVALIGPDGAGKTTICRQLETQLPFPSKYIYMGVNTDASNVALPTTRLVLGIKRLLGRHTDMGGPPDPARTKPKPKGLLRRWMSCLKSGLRLVNQVGDEWFRQFVIWSYMLRGHVVLFDRHFFTDYYAYDITSQNGPQSLGRRIHGYLLKRFYPRPDLTILLEAPAELLFERKREGSVELLQRRLEDYRSLRDVMPCFHTIDAAQPAEAVARDVKELIYRFYAARTRVAQTTQDSYA